MTLVESGLLLAQILERFETDRSWSEEILARSLASPRAKVRELLETLHSYSWPFAVTDDGRWTMLPPHGLRRTAALLYRLRRGSAVSKAIAGLLTEEMNLHYARSA